MNLSKYNLQNLRRVLNPKGISGVISKFGTDFNRKYYEVVGRPGGVEVIKQDWDNLLILDGCRHDLFQVVWEDYELDATLEPRYSRASHSRGFILENFIDRELYDTVYISANPFTQTIPENTFHYVRSLLSEEWDEELRTVPPWSVASAGVDAFHQFPNKRLIIHFMQPHYPFISERGQEIDESAVDPVALDLDSNSPVDNKQEGDSEMPIWRRLQFGLGITYDEVWEAYRENLELVLEEVIYLLQHLDGKTVITSDHGNLVGDRQRPLPVRGYGHPSKLFVDDLLEVPWVTLDDKTRRQISSEPPIMGEKTSEGNIDQQLEALGYK